MSGSPPNQGPRPDARAFFRNHYGAMAEVPKGRYDKDIQAFDAQHPNHGYSQAELEKIIKVVREEIRRENSVAKQGKDGGLIPSLAILERWVMKISIGGFILASSVLFFFGGIFLLQGWKLDALVPYAIDLAASAGLLIVFTVGWNALKGAKFSNKVKVRLAISVFVLFLIALALIIIWFGVTLLRQVGIIPSGPTAAQINEVKERIKEGSATAGPPPGFEDIRTDANARNNLLEMVRKELASRNGPSSTNADAIETASFVLAAIVLSNGLVDLDTYLDYQKHPRERAYIIRMCPAWVSPQLLVQHYSRSPPPNPAIKQAILLALAKYTSIPDVLDGWLRAIVLPEFKSNPDPGVHSAAEWLLSSYLPENVIAAEKKALIGTNSEKTFLAAWDPETSRSPGWFVNAAGITMIAFPPGEKAFITYHRRTGEAKKSVESRIPRAFAISATEITNGQYEFVVNGLEHCPDYSEAKGRARWTEAMDFCDKLDRCEGIVACRQGGIKNPEQRALVCPNYRLPTVAEWTLAARGWSANLTEKTLPGRSALEKFHFFFGDDAELLKDYEYAGAPHEGLPQKPVASYLPNFVGLFDVHGGMTERCKTLDANQEYPEVDDGDEANVGERRSRLGGSFKSPVEDLKDWDLMAPVYAIPDEAGYEDMGFRVAKTLKKP